MPPYVTWVAPSARVRVPSCPVTPVPAIGCEVVSSGGQAVAHEPVQVDVVALSPAWVYRVIPFGPVRTTPKFGVLAVLTVVPAAAGAPPPTAAGLAALEEHAATARTAAPSRARRRVADIWNAPR